MTKVLIKVGILQDFFFFIKEPLVVGICMWKKGTERERSPRGFRDLCRSVNRSTKVLHSLYIPMASIGMLRLWNKTTIMLVGWLVGELSKSFDAGKNLLYDVFILFIYGGGNMGSNDLFFSKKFNLHLRWSLPYQPANSVMNYDPT